MASFSQLPLTGFVGTRDRLTGTVFGHEWTSAYTDVVVRSMKARKKEQKNGEEGQSMGRKGQVGI
jgi:hypothetical protein